MNLPNYFLADLPPEATLSPAMITEACQTLKRNRERYLAQRTTHNLVHVLAEVAKGWLQTDNRFRKLALASGPAETGFSHATLAKGLDNFFRQFSLGEFAGAAGSRPRRGFMSRVTCHGSRFPSLVTGHSSLLARTGNARPHRGGQHPESGADEHRARFADAVGAVREMREWVGVFYLGSSRIRFTTPTRSSARASKLPNGAAAMRNWRRRCSLRRIA